MEYNIIFTCDHCKKEIEMPSHPKNPTEYSGGRCPCGGMYQRTGESYDQEFIEQEDYERMQDQEYEERHRHYND